MKRLVPLLIIVLCAMFVWGGRAFAEDALYKDIYAHYPRSAYIVGIGETQSTGSTLRDQRVAEILARRELAAQIRVHISEVAIDIACSGGAKDVAGGDDQCRDAFSSVLETRVNVFIQGSRIVEHGEYQGRVYAVAVMEKAGAAQKLQDEAGEAADQAQKDVERAKSGDADARERAKDEYLRARALESQGDAISGVKGQADKLFGELEKEILKLGAK